MNTWLFQDDDRLTASADALCRVVQQKYDDLRSCALGRRFKIGSVRFCLVQSDRNTVYRAANDHRWFLKMPRGGSQNVITREALGASACRQQLSEQDGYQLPDLVRVSPEFSYALSANISGDMLHRRCYRVSAVGGRTARTLLKNSFYQLGMSLAALHGFPTDAAVQSTRSAASEISGALKQVIRADKTLDLIRKHLPKLDQSAGQSFVHGNFKLENVMVGQRSVTLIDFENCGWGNRYDDLSLMCSQLMFTEAASWLPGSVFRLARQAFISGYVQRHQLCPETLCRFIGIRTAASYVHSFCTKKRRMTVAGMPISKHRARRLVQSLLLDDPSHMLPEMFPSREPRKQTVTG